MEENASVCWLRVEFMSLKIWHGKKLKTKDEKVASNLAPIVADCIRVDCTVCVHRAFCYSLLHCLAIL